MNIEQYKSLELLDKYFKETPKEEIEAEINLISKLDVRNFALSIYVVGHFKKMEKPELLGITEKLNLVQKQITNLQKKVKDLESRPQTVVYKDGRLL